jgi:hypothetical protein
VQKEGSFVKALGSVSFVSMTYYDPDHGSPEVSLHIELKGESSFSQLRHLRQIAAI